MRPPGVRRPGLGPAWALQGQQVLSYWFLQHLGVHCSGVTTRILLSNCGRYCAHFKQVKLSHRKVTSLRYRAAQGQAEI